MWRLRQIAVKAVAEGYGEVVKPRHVHLNIAMDCTDPYRFELFARSRKIVGRVVYTVTAESRCRKCEACNRRKSMFWTGRAISEYHRAARTWFGTLTLSPQEHYVIDARAQARLGRSGVNWQQLSAKEQFAERAKELGVEATKFIKRLRNGNLVTLPEGVAGPQIPHKPKIRYLLVAEMHDSAQTSDEMRGRPHFHMLLHEAEAGALVVGKPLTALFAGRSLEMEMRKYKTRNGWKPGVFAADNSFLRRNWTLGHTKFQLAESPMSAAYVCKYLTKALAVRVRASQGYGVERPPPKEKQVSKKPSVNDDPTTNSAFEKVDGGHD